MCHPVRAETCQEVQGGTQILCEKAGFERAVQKCSDAFRDSAACQVRLKAALASYDDLNTRYTKLVADSAPRSPTVPVLGYLAGIIGTGAVIAAPTLTTGSGVQWGIGFGGVLLVASGLWAILPR